MFELRCFCNLIIYRISMKWFKPHLNFKTAWELNRFQKIYCRIRKIASMVVLVHRVRETIARRNEKMSIEENKTFTKPCFRANSHILQNGKYYMKIYNIGQWNLFALPYDLLRVVSRNGTELCACLPLYCVFLFLFCFCLLYFLNITTFPFDMIRVLE
jgi:hypothetical protein